MASAAATGHMERDDGALERAAAAEAANAKRDFPAKRDTELTAVSMTPPIPRCDGPTPNASVTARTTRSAPATASRRASSAARVPRPATAGASAATSTSATATATLAATALVTAATEQMRPRTVGSYQKL